jgi:hypothetical protein
MRSLSERKKMKNIVAFKMLSLGLATLLTLTFAQTDTEVGSEGLPPNGVWQIELSTHDLAVMGLPGSSEHNEFTYTLTFQEGKFTSQLEGGYPCDFCEGGYEVVQEVVRVTLTAHCNGQVADLQWRLENDGLHFHLIALTNGSFETGRAILETKPWQKKE